MSALEKMMKALENLRVFSPNDALGNAQQAAQKKKLEPLTTKEKISNINVISDAIISQSVRSAPEFGNYLGFVMEVLLTFTGDNESDVRMVSDESLNKITKNLISVNLSRLQVELFKEIKKNGLSRCVRSSLWRFAELSPLTRPQKRRAYTVNLLPVINRLAERHEEALQESLQAAMLKMAPVFMKFATDQEIRQFSAPFLMNLCSTSAVVRRVAANCSALICHHSRKPQPHLVWLLNHSIEQIIPVLHSTVQSDVPIVLGAMHSIRTVIPLLEDIQPDPPASHSSSSASLNKNQEYRLDKVTLILIFEIVTHYMQTHNPGLVTASLELYQALIKSPLLSLMSILMERGSVTVSCLAAAYEQRMARRDATGEEGGVPGAGEPTVNDIEIISLDSSVQLNLLDAGHMVVGEGNSPEPDVPDSPASRERQEDEEHADAGVEAVAVGVEATAENEDVPDLEIPIVQAETPESAEVSPRSVPYNVGSLTDEESTPLLYSARVLLSCLLLRSDPPGLYPDSEVRVSIKSVALACLAAAVKLQPEIFSLPLFINTQGDGMLISEVLNYRKHHDPQVKGHIALILGLLVTAEIDQELEDLYTDESADDLSLPECQSDILSGYLANLHSLLATDSPVTTRLAMSACKTCLPRLLMSSHGDEAIRLLQAILRHHTANYWLVKVELLELLSSLDYIQLAFHVSARKRAPTQPDIHSEVTPVTSQDDILACIVTSLLADSDHRVRHAASVTLCSMVRTLFPYKVDTPEKLLIQHGYNLTKSQIYPLLPLQASEAPHYVLGLSDYYHKARSSPEAQIQANLSQLVNTLTNVFMTTSQPSLKLGVITALYELSEAYAVTRYPLAWCCSTSSSPAGDKLLTSKPERSTNSLMSIITLGDMRIGSGGGALNLFTSCLVASPLTLDLRVHEEVLTLASHLLSGAAYSALQHGKTENNAGMSDKIWPGLYDKQLSPLTDKLLVHLIRMMNIYATIVIGTQVVGTTSPKAVLNAARDAITSPIKKRVAKPELPGSEPELKTAKEAEKAVKNKKEPTGQFNNSTHYMKLYEGLKGAHLNYKVQLSLTEVDKFTSLLSAVLQSMIDMTEFMCLTNMGKYLDEILEYLHTLVAVAPRTTIQLIHQMLKALFGTNLSNQYEDLISSKVIPPRSPINPTTVASGVFSSCLSGPYSDLSQMISHNPLRIEHENSNNQVFVIRKSLERKTPLILKPESKVDKNTIAAYIRLFEPLVIRSLKIYTATSDTSLQCEVLNTIVQLIQLRVNYCLLDNDEVFLKFVLRQVELVSESPFMNTVPLTSSIFRLLMLLSYDKLHSKQLQTVPQIIQYTDGITASGDNSAELTLAALEQVVNDLFLCRTTLGSDQAKQDMEIQREFVMSMLIRLLHHHKAIDLLVVILHQAMTENEEKWKKFSRQVMDSVLPLLAKQQISLNTPASLNSLYQLFLVVSPSVYRPVDLLLKTLLTQPSDKIIQCRDTLLRWFSGLLAILRALLQIGKEEVVLSRLNDLDVTFDTSHMTSSTDSMISSSYGSVPPQQIVGSFLVQVLLFVITRLHHDLRCSSVQVSDLLVKQISHLLLFFSYVCQSGHFRKVTRFVMDSLTNEQSPVNHQTALINDYMLAVSTQYPTIMLQWCNLLILLNYEDKVFWSAVLKPNRLCAASLNTELVRRGSLSMYCDYVMDNIQHVEHLTWLTVNFIDDIIDQISETPVQDFLSTVYGNASASLLLVQAIHSRCEIPSSPSSQLSVLKCLKPIHRDQSGPLLSLLIDKLLSSKHLSVSRQCEQVAARRCEMLLADLPECVEKQLSLDELTRLIELVNPIKHRRLHSLICKLSAEIYNKPVPSLSPRDTRATSYSADKDFYIRLTKHICSKSQATDKSIAASLLGNLEEPDILSVMEDSSFQVECLNQCIQHSTCTSSRGDIGTVISLMPEQAGSSHPPLRNAVDKQISMLWLQTVPPPEESPDIALTGSMDESSIQRSVKFDLKLVSATCIYIRLMTDFKPDPPTASAICQLAIKYFSMWAVPATSALTASSTMMSSSYFESRDSQAKRINIDELLLHLELLSLILSDSCLRPTLTEDDSNVYMCIEAVTNILLSMNVVVDSSEYQKHQSSMNESSLPHKPMSPQIQICLLVALLSDVLLPRRSDLNDSLVDHLASVIVGLARLPLVYDYARMPLSAFIIANSDLSDSRAPEVSIDTLKDTAVLKEVIKRTNLLGWVTRKQFEEMWSNYLHLLSPLASHDADIHPEDDIENVEWMVTAFRGISALLLSTLNITSSSAQSCVSPHQRCVLHVGRNKRPEVLHSSKLGQSLHQILLYLSRHSSSPESCDCLTNQSLLCVNAERTSCRIGYSQLSMTHIHTRLAQNPPTPDARTTVPNFSEKSDLEASEKQSGMTDELSGPESLDLRSCLKLLTEIFSQLLNPGEMIPKTPLMLTNQCLKSILELSDLFTEKAQFDWMFTSLYRFLTTYHGDDELVNQYLLLGLCKSSAIHGTTKEQEEKLVKILEASFRSPHVPTVISSIHSCLYLLEARPGSDFINNLLPYIIEFINRSMDFIKYKGASLSEAHNLSLWSLVFYTMENFNNAIRSSEYLVNRILEVAGIFLSDSEGIRSHTNICTAIIIGLQRLILHKSLNQFESNHLLKLANDCLAVASQNQVIPIFSLMVTCIYSDMLGSAPVMTLTNQETALVEQTPEQLATKMEFITLIFDWVRKGLPGEAAQVTAVLPSLMRDLFTPHDTLNKVIAEFLSENPHPIFIAKMIFEVFEQQLLLTSANEENSLVQDWVMLSLVNFTQKHPISAAVWCLNVFFISSSRNDWLRATFPLVLSRMAAFDVIDEEIFITASLDFYSRLSGSEQQKHFISAYQSAARTENIYSKVLTHINSS